MGILEIGGNPLPTLKPRLYPSPKTNPNVDTHDDMVDIWLCSKSLKY
jgi:hypothetical protein